MPESPSSPRPDPPTAFLDGMRGLAAVYVLMHHAVLWLHPGYHLGYLAHRAEYSLWQKGELLAGQAFKFGHEAVIFFFVLSGFVIHLRHARRLADGRPVGMKETGGFLYRRARRLYPPLVFALLATFALDALGRHADFSIYRQATPYEVINHNVTCDLSLTTLAGNLLFVMQTYVPVWGTDSPLWSLKYEWWFYAIYPVLWPALNRSVYRATLAVAILFGLSFVPAPPVLWLVRDVLRLFPIWWLGVLLAEVYGGRLRLRWAWLAVSTGLAPAAVLAGLNNVPGATVLWTLTFAGLIAAGFALGPANRLVRGLAALKPLGDCSYTLYVFHAPVLVLAGGWLMSRSPTGELPNGFAAVWSAVLLVPVAYGLHYALERPFVRRQRRLAPAGGAAVPTANDGRP